MSEFEATPVHRARGLLRRAAVMLAPGAVSIARVTMDRDREQRVERLRSAARDRIQQARRPTRPTMRSLHLTAPGRVAWRAIPTPPPPGPDAAVVRPVAVATCDLDRAIAMGAAPFPTPLAIGHECVAEVLTVGDRVESVTPGQRVVLPFQISCGHCEPCRAGCTSNCLSVPPQSMYGFGLAGGHWGGVLADEVAVPFADHMLVTLPAGVDPATAASAADTMCDGYRHVAPFLPALRKRYPDLDVLILGQLRRGAPFAPSIPLYAGQVARALGVGRVRLVDARHSVRDAAASLGLEPLAPRELRGVHNAPLVVACSGSSEGLRTAFNKTAPDGICSSSGGLHGPARLPVTASYARNLTFHVGRTDARHYIPAVLGMIADGSLEPQHVISTRGSIDDAATLLDRHYRSEDIKTVLTAS